MAEIGAIGGNNDNVSLWTKAEAKRKQPLEETQAGGMSASFGPGGANFLDTVKSTYTTSGNNCGGI